MNKFLRVIFCVLALAACFQLTGIGEAHCDDAAADAGCQECMACAGHPSTEGSAAVSIPAIALSGYSFFHYSFRKIEFPPSHFLRPPITR